MGKAAVIGPRFGYRPALDGLRGIAVLLVVSFHAFEWPRGGFLGVDLFFVLSGFLITVLLLEEKRETGRISVPAFYLRRMLRLFPALSIFVIAASIVAALMGKLDESLLLSAFYLGNFALASGREVFHGVNHLWSLATEEQFYLLWPLVLAATMALVRTAAIRKLQATLVVLIVIITSFRASLVVQDVISQRFLFSPDARFDTILIGCLTGTFFVSDSQRTIRLARRIAGPGALLLGALVLVWSLPKLSVLFGGIFTLVAFAAAPLVVMASVNEATWLQWTPLVRLGRLSYSLYLWHVLVLVLIEKEKSDPSILYGTLAVGISFVMALLSYRFVEQPFLRLKDRFAGSARASYVPRSSRSSSGKAIVLTRHQAIENLGRAE